MKKSIRKRDLSVKGRIGRGTLSLENDFSGPVGLLASIEHGYAGKSVNELGP